MTLRISEKFVFTPFLYIDQSFDSSLYRTQFNWVSYVSHLDH